ncbi:hypothetical protein Mapa_006038 [Marchantia paleacea]|nr:hypothetical protein Mapa_006038 [Marchantia paleacea]
MRQSLECKNHANGEFHSSEKVDVDGSFNFPDALHDQVNIYRLRAQRQSILSLRATLR